MGKISLQSIKYIIHIKFKANSIVEKPDVIGAIFGQTEGLLGEELELRELQKAGKIGRINVELETTENKTEGLIEIPTSLDKTQTALIAAAVETIDRIGPAEASFSLIEIEDVRSSKREYIVKRAKELVSKLLATSPKLREIEKDITEYAKTSKLCFYGPEHLAAGPNVDSAQELIVVEGRADVINLLRAGIRNVIAMNGTIIPKTITELSKTKDLTLFVDGDRGGFLVAMNALKNGKIKFVARAPDGKEVEELTEKEIFNALRHRIPVEEFKENLRVKTKKEKLTSRLPTKSIGKLISQGEDKKTEDKKTDKNRREE